MVSQSETDKETLTGQPSQLSDRQQPDAGTHEPDISPGLHTIPQSGHPRWTNSKDNMLEIQSFSSKPNINHRRLHSRLDSVEQVPLIDADNLHRVQTSHVEDSLSKKNADFMEPFVRSFDLLVAENNKVTSEHVAGSETKKQDREVKINGDDDEIGNSVSDVYSNANIDSHSDKHELTSSVHLKQVNYVNAKSKDGGADDLSRPTATVSDNTVVDLNWPKASVREPSTSPFNSDPSSSGLTGDQHSSQANQKPAVIKFEQESSSQSDTDVRQLHRSDHSHSGRVGEDFVQQQADVNHRGYWHPDNQPSDVRFPGEYNQHLHHNSHPAWKHVHSSPVEEFHDSWPEMQEAWPEFRQKQRLYMNHLTDDDSFMQHPQRHFMNHQHRPHVRPEEGHYFQNHRTEFHGHDPNLHIIQWPYEDTGRHRHFGDMFSNQQHYDRSHYNREAGVRQPNVHVDQVFRQHPLDHRYVSSLDREVTDTGPVDKQVFSVRSSEQSGGQVEFQSGDGQGIQRPLSALMPEKATEDLTGAKQASKHEYYGDAGMLSSSQQYTDEPLEPPSPLINRRFGDISGEYLSKNCISSVDKAICLNFASARLLWMKWHKYRTPSQSFNHNENVVIV